MNYTETALKAKIDETLADNDTGLITESIVRTILKDVYDSNIPLRLYDSNRTYKTGDVCWDATGVIRICLEDGVTGTFDSSNWVSLPFMNYLLYNFSVASTRAAITSTDDIKGAFGKCQKYFNDLLTSFNGANKLLQLTSQGKYPALDGSLITGLQSSAFSGIKRTFSNYIDFKVSGAHIIGTTDSNKGHFIITECWILNVGEIYGFGVSGPTINVGFTQGTNYNDAVSGQALPNSSFNAGNYQSIAIRSAGTSRLAVPANAAIQCYVSSASNATSYSGVLIVSGYYADFVYVP